MRDSCSKETVEEDKSRLIKTIAQEGEFFLINFFVKQSHRRDSFPWLIFCEWNRKNLVGKKHQGVVREKKREKKKQNLKSKGGARLALSYTRPPLVPFCMEYVRLMQLILCKNFKNFKVQLA